MSASSSRGRGGDRRQQVTSLPAGFCQLLRWCRVDRIIKQSASGGKEGARVATGDVDDLLDREIAELSVRDSRADQRPCLVVPQRLQRHDHVEEGIGRRAHECCSLPIGAGHRPSHRQLPQFVPEGAEQSIPGRGNDVVEQDDTRKGVRVRRQQSLERPCVRRQPVPPGLSGDTGRDEIDELPLWSEQSPRRSNGPRGHVVASFAPPGAAPWCGPIPVHPPAGH